MARHTIWPAARARLDALRVCRGQPRQQGSPPAARQPLPPQPLASCLPAACSRSPLASCLPCSCPLEGAAHQMLASRSLRPLPGRSPAARQPLTSCWPATHPPLASRLPSLTRCLLATRQLAARQPLTSRCQSPAARQLIASRSPATRQPLATTLASRQPPLSQLLGVARAGGL